VGDLLIFNGLYHVGGGPGYPIFPSKEGVVARFSVVDPVFYLRPV
jgi:hypothetical protein